MFVMSKRRDIGMYLDNHEMNAHVVAELVEVATRAIESRPAMHFAAELIGASETEVAAARGYIMAQEDILHSILFHYGIDVKEAMNLPGGEADQRVAVFSDEVYAVLDQAEPVH